MQARSDAVPIVEAVPIVRIAASLGEFRPSHAVRPSCVVFVLSLWIKKRGLRMDIR
jgi:hypothetical protein